MYTAHDEDGETLGTSDRFSFEAGNHTGVLETMDVQVWDGLQQCFGTATNGFSNEAYECLSAYAGQDGKFIMYILLQQINVQIMF